MDDEYVRNVIAMTKGNNDVGANHFKNKGLRSLQRSVGLSNITFRNPKQLNFIKDDDKSKTMAVEVDRNRFDKVMRKIAYGLFYFKFNQTWSYKIGIATHNLVTDSLITDPIAERIQYYNKLGVDFPYEGSNQEVFKYSFLHFTFSNHKWLVMKFYDWFEVWAIPKDSSIEPSLET